MGPEEIIYTRLAADTALTDLVDSRIYPTTPTENNPAMPFVVYTVLSAAPELHTLGSAGLTRHDLQIDVFGVNMQSDVLDVLDAVKDSLHCWTSTDVKGCFLNGRNTTDEQESYHHGVATFSLWVRS